ncbi:hypothetical protein F5884DRAFT_295652 [Xylogone sp. PMI_703]|nr:hypothetical protein F5884DRAFT_295652 [Xylogone sp. PMI_703]
MLFPSSFLFLTCSRGRVRQDLSLHRGSPGGKVAASNVREYVHMCHYGTSIRCEARGGCRSFTWYCVCSAVPRDWIWFDDSAVYFDVLYRQTKTQLIGFHLPHRFTYLL